MFSGHMVTAGKDIPSIGSANVLTIVIVGLSIHAIAEVERVVESIQLEDFLIVC